MADDRLTVTLRGEDYELETPDTLRVEGLPGDTEAVLVTVDGEGEAAILERLSAGPKMADAVWSTDVEESDHDHLENLSVEEFQSLVQEM